MLLNLVTSLSMLASTACTQADSVAQPPDSTATVIISSITVTGNKVTRRHIVLRELDFEEGDSIRYIDLTKKLKKAKQNLLNSSLFNFASVDTFDTRNGTTKVLVNVSERWYTWPVPIFELADRNFNAWWETRNFSRINYGFFLNRDNFRGRKEKVALIAQFGFSQRFGFSYSIPYLNKKQTEGVNMSFVWSRNHEINYGSANNRVLFFKDEKDYARRELSAKLGYTYRQGIYNTFTIEARYILGHISDTISEITTNYFLNNQTRMEYLTTHLFMRRDCRDAKAYPLRGYYLDADIVKVGLGILPKEQVDLWYFTATARKYFRLSDRFFFATSLRGKISSKTSQPYYTQRGLGYSDYVRGFEYYVIDGQRYALGKAGLKYMIVKPHVKKLDFVRSEKFNTFHYALYAELFGDAGYVEDNLYGEMMNPLANEYLYGYGIGLNYVTYYDAVLRLEYSFNKLNEHGLFLHLWAPI